MLSISVIAVEFEPAGKAKPLAFPPILPILPATLPALILPAHQEDPPKQLIISEIRKIPQTKNQPNPLIRR
jgi:hypothetical protein